MSRKQSRCSYCGSETRLTRDHVIPQNLFPKPRPATVITVGACSPCQQLKAKDDQFLRDYLLMDAVAGNNPIASDLYDRKVRRSISRGSSELARHLQAQPFRRVPLVTPAGLYVDFVIEAPLPQDRVAAILTRVVRGLYYSSRRNLMPASVRSKVLRRSPADFASMLDALGPNRRQRVMGAVFGCAFLEDPVPFRTIWLLWFFESVVFTVETEPPAAV